MFVGGHWVPQMIEFAGGEDVLGLPGEKSRTASWEEVAAAAPEIVVVDALRIRPGGRPSGRRRAYLDRLRPLGARVVSVDAAAYFSRPGPRLVDGVELLAHLLHPELAPSPLDVERKARDV